MAADIFSIIVVILTSAVGGILIALIGGLHQTKLLCIPAINTKALFSAFKIPPLIGMILMGMVARNCFGREVIAYQEKWASMIREICLTLLLIRGGLTIKFQGKGLVIALITIIP